MLSDQVMLWVVNEVTHQLQALNADTRGFILSAVGCDQMRRGGVDLSCGDW